MWGGAGMRMGMGMGTTSRFGAAFLVRVGQLETQLYDACLGPDEDQDAAENAAENEAKTKGEEEASDGVAGEEEGD